MNVWNTLYKHNVFITNVLLSLVLVTLVLPHLFNSLAVILFFCFALIQLFHKSTFCLTKSSVVSFLIFALCILSFFWSYNATITIKAVSRFLSYVIIPISFAILHKNISFKPFFNFTYFIVFFCLVSLFVACYNFSITGDVHMFFYHTLSGQIFQINAIYLSVFTSFAFFVLISKRQKGILDYCMLIFLLLFLFLLSSKLIVVSVIIILFFIIFKKIQKNRCPILIGFFMLIITLFFSTKHIKERFLIEFKQTNFEEVLTADYFGDVYPWTGTTLRLFQQRAFIETLNKPMVFVVGNGLDAGQQVLNNIYKHYGLYHGYYGYNYHNQYIQIFSELGFIGFLLLVAILVMAVKNAYISKDILFVSFVFLMCMIFITESFIWRSRGMIFFLTVLFTFDYTYRKHA